MGKTISSLKSSDSKFKSLDPEVKLYIHNLEKENFKLQSIIVKIKVSDFSKSNEIIALNKEIKKLTSFQKNQVRIYLPEKEKLKPPPEE